MTKGMVAGHATKGEQAATARTLEGQSGGHAPNCPNAR